MDELIPGMGRALRDLTRPAILWQALWPPLVSLVLWIGLGAVIWAPARAAIEAAIPDLPWLAGWAISGIASMLLLLALAPLVYLTTVILVAGFALPAMMRIVAASDYPLLERRGSDAVIGSLVNALKAGVIYLLGWLVCLPLLLIPGMIAVVSLWWATWLNQRAFRYDAMVEHATAEEMRTLVSTRRPALYGAGLVSALAMHVPVVNFIAPAWSGLLFVHVCLSALQRQRRDAGELVVELVDEKVRR